MPIHNAEHHIIQTFGKLDEYVSSPTELIAVENGSIDNSWELVQKYSFTNSNLVIRIISSDKGLGAALRTGINRATGEFIAFMADDLPFEFQEIEVAEDMAKNRWEGIIFLSKYHEKTIVKRDFKRRFLAGIFRFNRDLLLHSKIRDTQGSFVGSNVILKYLASQAQENGFAITTELAFLAQKSKIKLIEIPVKTIIEARTISTVNIKSAAQLFLGISRIWFRYWFLKKLVRSCRWRFFRYLNDENN